MNKKQYIIPHTEASLLIPHVVCGSAFPEDDHASAPARRTSALRAVGSLGAIGTVK